VSSPKEGKSDRERPPLEFLSEEIARKLTAVAAALRKGVPPSVEDLDALEALSRLKTLIPAHDNGRWKKIEIGLLCVTALLLIGIAFVRMPSTAVDLDVRATKVRLTLTNQRSATLIPGELGEILTLKQARVSGADVVLPPTVGESGSFELKQLAPSTERTSHGGSEDFTVRLQEISIPSDSPLTIVVGVAYAAGSRGLVFEASGSEASTARFGEVIPLGKEVQNEKTVRYAISPVRATGKNLTLELFPANAERVLTVFRDVNVSEVYFEDAGHSTILGGLAFIKSRGEASVPLQPSDRLTIRSASPMLVRDLTLTKGELKATLSAPHAATIQLGEDLPRNLMPTLFEWIRFHWPNQLYATLSALTALWLATRRWWGSSK
jgi:hypothetical protein